MAFPDPGTTLEGAVVYKTVSLAELLPAAVVAEINQAGYADLDFAYGQSSEVGASVTVAGTTLSPVISYTNASGSSASLTVASVGSEGPNGFQFTDPSGDLWTVLDNPPSTALAADPLLEEAISKESGNLLLVLELQQLKSEIDRQSGGNPVVFPTDPLQGNPACFARGTRIATVDGERLVEELSAGDRVRTVDGDEAPVIWVGRRRLNIARHPRPETVAPVRLEVGALSANVPSRPLRLSPDHALFIDGVLIPAGLLVNGRSIVREQVDVVEYFHVEISKHAVLIADGAPAESYIDTGNRSMFANAALVDLHPDMMGGHAADLCAEMLLDGDRLDAIRVGLVSRSNVRRAS